MKMLWDGEGCTVVIHRDRDPAGWFYVDLDGECFESGTNPDDARRIIGQVCDIVTAWGDSIDKGATIAAALDILAPWFAEREAQSNSESTCEACPSPAVIQLSYTRWRCGDCYEKFCDGRLTQYYEDLDRDRRDIALAPIARALGDPHGPIYGLDRVDCKWCGRPSMIESEYCSDECAHSDTDAECEHCELETRVGLLVGERLCDDCDAKEKLYERSYEEAAKSQEAAGLGPVTQSKSMAKSSSSGGSSMSTDTVRVRRVLDNAWIEYVTTEDVVLGLIGTHHGADIIPTIYPQGEGSVHLGKHETARAAETALLTEMTRRGWVIEDAPDWWTSNPENHYGTIAHNRKQFREREQAKRGWVCEKCGGGYRVDGDPCICEEDSKSPVQGSPQMLLAESLGAAVVQGTKSLPTGKSSGSDKSSISMLTPYAYLRGKRLFAVISQSVERMIHSNVA